MRLFDLSGKVAIITGSSRGIGQAIAEAFAEAGGRVVISARNSAPCEEAAAAIRAKGGEAIAVTARISDKAQLENLVAKTREAWGRIDILVCNAAINPHYGSLEQLTDEVFERMMVNNVLSNLWLSRISGPTMRDGAIIFIISTAALRASTMLGMYGCTKAADYALCRNLAGELGRHDTRRDAVDAYVVRAPFGGEVAAQGIIRGLGHPVHAEHRAGAQCRCRDDVDDRAVAPYTHFRPDHARQP